VERVESVEVVDADLDGGVLIRNLYPLYLHDLSAFTEFYDVDAQGAWFPDYLPDWLEPRLSISMVHPMVIRAEGRPAGFALVAERPFPHMTPGRDFRMCEFFVLNRLRRRGVGRRAAGVIFARFRGLWEVSELPGNARAIAFWRRVIGELTGERYTEAIEQGDVVQVFDSARPGG
jgi:predicted acetyltransferase